MKWAYGITTVKERAQTYLPATLKSLAAAGFDAPRLFVDDERVVFERVFHTSFPDNPFPATYRNPRVRTYGNWLLALVELVLREPSAERYALFQDDLIVVRDLKSYLEECRYDPKGYWNLYTFPENQAKFPADPAPDRQQSQQRGWFPSNQRGRGALGLVFSGDVAYKLLSSPHAWTRLRDPQRGWQAVDGAVVTALAHQGIKEFVHNPSLSQHAGDISSMNHPKQPLAPSFPGEHSSALDLLPKR